MDTFGWVVFGAILSIVGGYIAQKWLLKQEDKRMKKVIEEKFRPIAGEYIGYGVNITQDGFVVGTEPQSDSTIKYIRDNILEITTWNRDEAGNIKYEWQGIMVMNKDYEGMGRISWEYCEGLPENKRRWGFKECFVKKEEDEIIIVGEEPVVGEDGKQHKAFWQEVLKRKKPTH
ncbi:hypothetical protein [Candidatus Oleimmundimicrobium sp.]|uniref:hypothetical protein n=1 Tax=Candidatus Oleimmundimicrobium sp. TaxID=3060597 RepID=UPI0027231CB0|nr:hypothetical protein [Candidatus Oleimmundimicrobium sp.]MDO8885962.1 hypothetical protein [Candidatus Oleimmundimicrobium sp.]